MRALSNTPGLSTAQRAILEDYIYIFKRVPTSKKAEDTRAILRLDRESTPTEKLLFRKINKVLDQKNF